MATLDDSLALRPELASAYQKLLAHAPALLGERRFYLVQARMAQLHSLPAASVEPVDDVERRIVEFVELFVIDVHAISDDQAAALRHDLGNDGLISLASACAVLDGHAKLQRVLETEGAA